MIFTTHTDSVFVQPHSTSEPITINSIHIIDLVAIYRPRCRPYNHLLWLSRAPSVSVTCCTTWGVVNCLMMCQNARKTHHSEAKFFWGPSPIAEGDTPPQTPPPDTGLTSHCHLSINYELLLNYLTISLLFLSSVKAAAETTWHTWVSYSSPLHVEPSWSGDKSVGCTVTVCTAWVEMSDVECQQD